MLPCFRKLREDISDTNGGFCTAIRSAFSRSTSDIFMTSSIDLVLEGYNTPLLQYVHARREFFWMEYFLGVHTFLF